MTSVININDAPIGWQYNSDYVYIGREGHGLSGYWGNPIKLESEKFRGEVIQLYIHHITRKYKESFAFRDMLKELRGKKLVCFCAPKLCHGDILAMLADISA